MMKINKINKAIKIVEKKYAKHYTKGNAPYVVLEDITYYIEDNYVVFNIRWGCEGRLETCFHEEICIYNYITKNARDLAYYVLGIMHNKE